MQHISILTRKKECRNTSASGITEPATEIPLTNEDFRPSNCKNTEKKDAKGFSGSPCERQLQHAEPAAMQDRSRAEATALCSGMSDSKQGA
jgi:hypothetical protein